MRTFTRFVCVALIPIFLLSVVFSGPVSADDVFSPDNANKPDPMSNSKRTELNVRAGQFTGAAIYDYPLSLPAGRNGMTPAVQFTYNSQDEAPDNIAGYHWDTNLFSIQRINKKGVENLYSRNDFAASTPVGGGELVPVQLVNGPYGVYGQKTERDFVKYEYREDGSWVVTDKTGTRYTFGAQAETRQFDPSDPARVSQWMLEEARDLNDNFIRYTYYKDGNQIYPKSIHYTGHGTEDGIFEVRFLPFANDQAGPVRPDSHFGYDKGFRVDTRSLITGVEVLASGVRRHLYSITYTSVNPLIRQTIGSFAETAYGTDGKATALPPTRFDYTPSAIGWQETTDYLPNWLFETCYYNCGGAKNILEWDMTGDGLVDFEAFVDRTPVRAVNNGQGGWTYTTPQFIGSDPAYDNAIPSPWRKPADFDGDARPDILASRIMTDRNLESSIRTMRGGLYFNTVDVGMGWFVPNKPDHGASLGDLNGDGLTDIIQSHHVYWGGSSNETIKSTCLNHDGNSCQTTSLWGAPHVIADDSQYTQLPRPSYVQDCNYDGLADFYYAGSGAKKWVNDGRGGWIEDNSPQCRFQSFENNTQRLLDANGDGLLDTVLSYRTNTDWGFFDTNEIILNTGNGGQNYSNQFPILLGVLYNTYHQDSGVRITDLNGDGLPDIIQSLQTQRQNEQPVITKKVYMNRGSRPYFLKTVHTSGGATIDLQYKNSAQYNRADGTRANPNLPVNVVTLNRMTVSDGMGNTNATEYFYEDGNYHYSSVDKREMAGFRVVTVTDGLGYRTKTYYHQSESSVADTEHGEWADHISKKGLAYRTEIYDTQNRLVKAVVNRYDKQAFAYERNFPFLKQTVSADYDSASGERRATAQSFEYDSYGNLKKTVDYGEVQMGGENGGFTDVGDDLLRTENTFAQNQDAYLVALPSERKTFDQAGQLIAHQRLYYDGLSLNEAVVGNLTKAESWLDTENRFLSSVTEYNEFGLPVSQTNPRGNTAVISYDSFQLYPESQTNALDYTTFTEYDPATGSLVSITDPNGAVSRNTYDGFGRPVRSEITDPNTKELIIAKTTIYGDYTMPRSVRETLYNDDGNSVDNYTYLDGFGRTVETKRKSPNGQWSVSGALYDARGNIRKTLQAYFSGSSAFESVDGSRIGTTFTYDTLNRVLTATNPLGTVTTDYGLWSKTLTDPNGKTKDFSFNARGQLISTTEHEGGDRYKTVYDYDSAGRMTGLTDALGNTREFAYDSLGRRLTQTDAHAPGQPSGLWSYAYDENGNLTQQTDPLGQITARSYDALDRITVEDFLGADGTEFTYVYDTGDNAVGRLSEVDGQDYQHRFEYDILGRPTGDHRQIGGHDFSFLYTYDLMGGVKRITYPDDMTVYYDYDGAHQLSRVYSDGSVFADQFDYTPLGQLATIRLGGRVVTTNTYDPNELYRLKTKQTAGTGDLLQDFSYTYDPMGNLNQLIDGSDAKTINYQYDDLYRLTQANYTGTSEVDNLTMSYQYNAIGDMVYKSDVGAMEYNHHNPHAVTKAGDHVYDYDLSGNLITRDSDTFVYDYRNRLAQSADGATYAYDESGQRIRKGNKYYPSQYYENDGDQEVKYVFAGNLKIAKVARSLITPPEVEEVVGSAEVPHYTFRGIKEAGLSLWVNDIEILPAGPETEWEYNADLPIGENSFAFYTKKEEAASRRVTRTVAYHVPAPTVEPVESPVTSTRLLLSGAKRANTSVWINGLEVVPLNTETTWEYPAVLAAEQNPFAVQARDELEQASDSAQFTVSYFATPPVVDEFIQPVTANPFVIRGTKADGMGIWINGNESVAPNADAAWQASLTLQKGINSFMLTAKNEFGVESTGTLLTIPYDVNAPTLDPVQSPTHEVMVTLSGTKPAYTSVWINGKQVIPMNADEFWGYTVELKGARNTFTISIKDEEGLESESLAIALDYEAAPPSVDMAPPSVSVNPYPFSGTKPAGTAIWINGQEVVPADDTTVWVVYLPLADGPNHFEIVSRSRFGIVSDPVAVDLSYTRPTSGTAGVSGGGGGGGYSDPIISPFLQKRLDEKKAQEELIAATQDTKKTNAAKLNDPKTLASLILYSQSGDRQNTPKALWPTASSQTGAAFKNLQVIYKTSKAVLSWDKMSREVAAFEVYRSKAPYPDRHSTYASELIATLEASSSKNRYTDDSVGDGERYLYQIVARDHNGDIILASIPLNAELIFVAGPSGSKIDFSRYTDQPFNKVHLSKSDHLDFEETSDPTVMKIKPKKDFRFGAKVQVRFIQCEPKKNGGDYCTQADEKILDVYVIQKPGIASRLKELTSLLIPSAYAADVQPEEKVYYYLTDHLGGVDVVLDDQGNVVERREYLPFGSEHPSLSDPSPDSNENYGFTGKELDDETGLYYYGARYYDPVIARFTSQDPWSGDLSDPQTLNKYSYTLNNPVRYVDPTGNVPKDASFLDKLFSVLTYDRSNKAGGWLAYSAREYDKNPTDENLSVMSTYQTLALGRLFFDPSSFTDETWDPVTTKRIQQLDPQVRVPATDFINQLEDEQDIQLRVTDAFRTNEQQDELYAQGRTKPGKIVTNARGGESYHNYSLAMDVVIMKDRQPVWETIGKTIANVATNLGFEWGGSWDDPDYPHFQMTLGQSIGELQQKAKEKKEDE